jgi:AcrR family transcriptional regulator
MFPGMAGGAMDDVERRAGTPRSELARIRGTRAELETDLHREIQTAVLKAGGEQGFRGFSVRSAIERYGGNRAQFYRHFPDKAAAYEEAYAVAIDTLCERLLRVAGAERGWRPGLRAALWELGKFLVEQPLVARAVLVEVHVAGGGALGKRALAYDRLAEAIDRARAEPGHADPGPPPLTARFMLGAVDSAAAAALVRDEPAGFAALVPELSYMIVAAYFDEKAAAEELTAEVR